MADGHSHSHECPSCLLLVALLENAGRRAEEAAQEKLNVIAEALEFGSASGF